MRALTLALLLGPLACSTAVPPAVLDAGFANGRLTQSLESLAADRLEPDEYVRRRELGKDPHSTHLLVWVRDREVLHRHDEHDLLAVILRGQGEMHLGSEERTVGPGSILFIPRGQVHAYRNTGAEPTVVYAVFYPPYEGKDKQNVDAAEPTSP